MKTSRRSSSPRSGITLIEVLVILGVLALLAAFFLPSLQRTRVGSRRSQCRNNLKQLGLALHNYHDTFVTTFPPGYIYHTQAAVPESEEDVPFSNGWGWTTLLIPYHDLAQTLLMNTLYSRESRPNIDLGLTVSASPQIPKTGSLELFYHSLRCPSDVGSQTVTGLPGGLSNKPCGRTNYFGVVGSAFLYSEGSLNPTSFCSNVASFSTLPIPPVVGAPVPGALGRCFATENDPFYSSSTVPVALVRNYGGIFGANSMRGFGDMTDGTSNIIMVGERYTPVNATPLKTTVIGDGIWPGVSALAAEYNALGEATHPINAGFTQRNQRPPTTGFGSLHTGGAQFLMADGAVRFLSENLDIVTYRNLSRIDDGMKIGDF